MREELMRRAEMGGDTVGWIATRERGRGCATTKIEKSESAIRSTRMSGGFKMERGNSQSPPSTNWVYCGCKSNEDVDRLVQLRVNAQNSKG
jgi:hypothetical protein